MNKLFIHILLSILIVTLFTSCNNKDNTTMDKKILQKDNLFAWCIIPYDSMNRTSAERADMLIELGLSSYAYDWREEHLPNMAHELKVMKEKNIGLTAVWFWVDGRGESFFDANNEIILNTLKEENVQPDIWVGIPDEYFGDISETEKLIKGKELIDYTYQKAKEIGCTISLYNHGGWYGEPENQVKIIEALGYEDIGIIYNFHHGHDQIDKAAENFAMMKKYLRAVNINGMKKDGPKTIQVGEGNEEVNMLKHLIASGYDGPIGILGHLENVDVKDILQGNLDGVEKIKAQL